ncbi:histidine kinase, partial [Streptomyces sp. UNOC14_S4]|nr:histidine kinase [Streptomyces sp. UNOC14_S4]
GAPERTGQFALPASPDAPNSTSGQHARPVTPDAPNSTSGQYAQPNATGQFALPQSTDAPNSTSGQYAQPNATGQYALPQSPDTPNSTSGQYAQPSTTGQYALPQNTDAPNSTSGQYAQPSTTGQHARPVTPDTPNSTSGQYAQPQAAAPQAPVDDWPTTAANSGPGGLTAVPSPMPANGAGETRTPLFEQLESNWFRGGADENHATAAEPSADAPQRLPRREPRQTLSDPSRMDPSVARQSTQDTWRDSPNDERWRRAEQVRVPAADGTTASGLPRRVPRANLVEGTADAGQSDPTGPQVSRSPDDVRGRLTNLRRGIQQGRQAGGTQGTGSHNVGPTYQQER